jgi:hypothetical protein
MDQSVSQESDEQVIETTPGGAEFELKANQKTTVNPKILGAQTK